MERMIVTPTAERNLESLRTALLTSNAVLIQGEIGCGKSLFVHHLADEYGTRQAMLQVNVDDTFDSKDLLGKFTATETPGSFEWVPGPLTQAVEKGHWILMEDIDLASFDVFSVLLSLLENSTLFISDKNKLITAHPDFKLIATQQLYTAGDSLLSRKAASFPFMELWGAVIMENMPAEELCEIVRTAYPNVPEETVSRFTDIAASSGTGAFRPFSLRTLLKWAKRVHRRLSASAAASTATGNAAGGNKTFISSRIREIMLKEAFDCFVARLAPGNEQNVALALIADACEVPINVAEPLVLEDKATQQLTFNQYTVGRVSLPLISSVSGVSRDSRIAFAPTRNAMSLLEKLAAAVEGHEHVLLTGETGVGKTFIVQYLADQLGQNLVVHNLNQQTDTSDFMGGWKPLDVGVMVREVYTIFTDLFSKCFNPEKNIAFLSAVQQAVNGRQWDKALRQMLKGCASFRVKHQTKPFEDSMMEQWTSLEERCESVLDTLEKTKSGFAFSFEEGSLVKAWREGWWILLDEVNLATNEVLERVSSVLGDVEKLFLTDKADAEPIPRHPNFHVFANMNPPTDVGKKDLPPSLRSRFTECYVSEPFNQNDINIVVKEYIGFLTADPKVDEITNFFLDCVQNAKTQLCALDGESKPPSFSLRTLTRALSYVRKATPLYGFNLALFDGLMLGFATPLQRQFHAVVETLIVKNVFKGKRPQPPRLPTAPEDGKFVPYEHIWVPAGEEEPYTDEGFILTDSVSGHLTNLARAVFANRPVLLEGPTSSGKSSMVKYLAELTGNTFVRINNHDSTEVQEYLGYYVTDEQGKLRFVDGILVNAVRNGYWVVLDELNLAPTDVLEALNRLLDDNCELFIPDTQETIKPHPQLRIFATQNPAGTYGGRKMLSRAFRNRFLEITVDEIPTGEISTILQRRYALPESFADKMVETMTALQIRRQSSQIFAGRHGFITPRDLFRWAERKPATYLSLAEHGFLLLGERCRKPQERQVVKDVIEQVMHVELDEKQLYHPAHWPFVETYFSQVENGLIDEYKIVWTESMQRLFTIVGICLEHQEPVLLVGETGSSKTTVCQLWAALLNIPLHIMNCHQHTEASDFLGSLRPVPPDRRSQALFEWKNGPLVDSMMDGHFFVLDEISLTEDSVLERLNSVLEPSRSVTLAEKSTADFIVAADAFRILATMNPGGDFGKKELSPALRNRFTEVYVRPTTEESEVALILSKRLVDTLEPWSSKMASVLCSVSNQTTFAGTTQHISIRDIIAWAAFMNAACDKCDGDVAFLQGLDAVVLDGIGVGTGQSEVSAEALRDACVAKAEAACQCTLAELSKPFWEYFEGMTEPQLPEELQNRFFFGAPATRRNLSKLMRASIVKKAVLLEGSPGVGKTSIVEALGLALSRPVVRINLSDQTDIMDLFGTFLPRPSTDDEEGGEPTGPQFAWSDGVLLRALKEGSWVILDELNLANQTVLEGLNALLDHRSAVFIPELNQEFHAHENFAVFACQNPLIEGGGRKGLPRSFLNRFIKVRVEAFDTSDLISIAEAVCTTIDQDVLKRMVAFVGDLQSAVMVHRQFGMRGSPWEFNLRDILRWAKLMQVYDEVGNPTSFADMLFLRRLRTDEDRTQCMALLARHFDSLSVRDGQNSDFLVRDGAVYFEEKCLTVRLPDPSAIAAQNPVPLLMLPSQASVVKSLLMCVEQNQLALLVGPAGSGKTFALRTAAELAGATLLTFSMNASCDTVDLLGGFDQVEGKQGCFEWRDSLVLEAMLQGHWLVLDNVNYCNASVLDRLNPLVEPNGVLSINEQGLVNDEVRVIRPHPNFRLFATMNPRYGEISRAMRNRAVEIYVNPITVPSQESLALTGLHCEAQPHSNDDTATADANAEQNGSHHPNLTQTELQLLSDFHHRFVKLGFHADTTAPGSAMLCDALAAGAPNTFTLVRTATMLRQVRMEDGLRRLILHRYITNRSGHWRHKKAELTQLLTDMLNAAQPVADGEDEEAATAHAPKPQRCDGIDVQTLIATLLLVPSADGTESRLCANRVGRALLPVHVAMLGGDKAAESAASAVFDAVLYYVLDQCNDAVALSEMTRLRIAQLQSLLLANSSEWTALCDAAVSVITEDSAASTSVLPRVFCHAQRTVGPHANALSYLDPIHSQISDYPLLNQSLSDVLIYGREWVMTLDDPVDLQTASRVAVLFTSELRQLSEGGKELNARTYVPIATRALLLHALSLACDTPTGQQLSTALEQFLESLTNFLGLPFSFMDQSEPLADYVPATQITTAEERAVFAAWTHAASTERASNAAANPAHESLQGLWSCAAFRGEFHLIQRLLALSNPYSRENGASFATQLRLLQTQIVSFIELFSKVLPLYTTLETTLWQSLATLSADSPDAPVVIASTTPLLIGRCLSKFGLEGIQLAIPASWTASASACIDYAKQVDVLAVGSAQNSYALTLQGTASFFNRCPVASSEPFAEWEQNGRLDLIGVLLSCFPDVADVWVPHNRGTDALLWKAIQSSLAQATLATNTTSAQGSLNKQKPLMAHILMLLLDTDRVRDDKASGVAVMTLLWSLKCRLLLPASPIDPMYRNECEVAMASEELALLERLEGAFTHAERVMLRTWSPQRDVVTVLLQQEAMRLSEARQRHVARPDSSGFQYAELVREMYNTCTSLLSDARLFAVTAPETRGDTCEGWSALVFQQIQELVARYGGYEDVTINFAQSALFAALAGRAMSLYVPQPSTDKRSRRALFPLTDTLHLMEFPTALVGSLPLPVTEHSHLRNRLVYLDSCLSLLRSCPAPSADRDFVEGVFSAYRQLQSSVESLEAKERKEEEMAVLYKEKALLIEGDDEALLRKLKDLFPSFETEFVEAANAVEEAADAQNEEEQKEKLDTRTAKFARIMFKEQDGVYVRRMVIAHQDFYARLAATMTGSCTVDLTSLLTSYTHRFDVLAKDLQSYKGSAAATCLQGDIGRHEEQLLLSGFSSRVALLQKEMKGALSSTIEDRKSSGFNIFTDADPRELSQFSKPLQNLLAAVDKLLATYPDIVSLQRCRRIGSKVAALPALSTPLMKVLSGCEVLLRECYEWERNASHEVSLMTHMTELSSFVLRWRRLELHCWTHIFNAKYDEYERAVNMRWFEFYDLMRFTPSEGDDSDDEDEAMMLHCRRVFERFSQFMWGACLGDFTARLRLLRGFGLELLVSQGHFSPLASVTLHVVDFFSQFESFVADRRRKAIEPVEDDIIEFTKIMRWEDANYYAVRATSEKSHLKMARVLGNLEDALRAPVLALIQEEEHRCEEDVAMGFTVPETAKKSKKSKDKSKSADANKKNGKAAKRSRSGKRLSPTAEAASADPLLAAAHNEGWMCTAIRDGQQFLEDSAEEIIDRVKALQTPKTPNQQKVRALKTLFDVMMDAGVPHTHEGQAQQWELLFATTETLLACRSVHTDQLASCGAVGEASLGHYRFARWVQRMREGERKPHDDLSAAQVKRGTGMVEALFADSVGLSDALCTLFEARHSLATLQAYCNGLKVTAEETESDTHHTAPADGALLDSCVRLSCSLQATCGALEWMSQEQVANLETRELLVELASSAEALWHLCLRHEPLRRSEAAVPPGIVRQFVLALRKAKGVLDRLEASTCAKTAAAAQHVGRAVAEVAMRYDVGPAVTPALEKRARTEGSEPWHAQVEMAMNALLTALNDDAIDPSSPTTASAKALPSIAPDSVDANDAERLSGDDEEEDDKADTPPVYKLYREKCTNVTSAIRACASTLQALVPATNTDNAVTDLDAASVKQLLRLIQQGLASIEGAQTTLVTTLQAHSSTGVVLSRLFTILLKKGFCKTEDDPEEQEGDGDGGQQEGTGMDDGHGEKDVTDEIENEDQLMNMKDKEEQPEEEEGKKKDEDGDEEDEDNAADVETDFQGQKEARDESDDNEDEEGDESDKELGSVDDEDERDRKKTRKDKGDDDDMSNDEGGNAEDVPDDEFGQEDVPLDEETGGFENKEDEIREAEEKRDGDHDLVGDDDDRPDMEDMDSDEDSDGAEERSNPDGEDREEDATDSDLDKDSDRSSEKDGSNDDDARSDDEESTDFDGSTQGEREVEQDENEDLSGSDVESASDGPDENVFEGGLQDDEVGQESTERKREDKDKSEKQQQPAESNAAEEQQPDENQEQDDAGQNFQKQQEQNENAQRKDNTEQNRSQHNPYRAIKEALQRHQRQAQQLNLNKHVEVKKDDDKSDEKQPPHPQDDKGEQSDVEEFDFDEDGDREGMAAAESAYEKPTEEAEPEEDNAPSNSDETMSESGDEEEAPQDTRRKRHTKADDINEVENEEDDEENTGKKKKKPSSKLTAKTEQDHVSDEEDIDEEDDTVDDGLDEATRLDAKLERGRQLWLEQETAVQGLAQQLCEQLRLILAPTLADKLQGDYKTGKRLNMKRIIPYIASQFKKDRIWLRRTKPNKRTYQIMVALDDSLSMQCNHAGELSCRSVALIAKALQQLEVGEVGIACFGKETHIVHPLEEPFGPDSGPRAFSEITFKQTSTNMKLFLDTVLTYLDEARERMHGQTRSTTQQLQQLMFVLSDGQITEDRGELRKLMVRAEENHQMVVFVILDIKAAAGKGTDATNTEGASAAASSQPPALTSKDLKGLSTAERMRRLKADRDSRLKRVQSNSILDMQIVEFKGTKVVRRSYMEDFPFPYYLIVNDLQRLPEVIADAMRQWFELLNAGQ